MNSLKQFDKSFLAKKVKHLAGVDEAGRGPLAGPVVAAAVIFDKKAFQQQINDSKKISEPKREELYEWIIGNCISYGVGIIDHKEIDEINILQASLKAMKIAASQLEPLPSLILIDGNKSFFSDIKSMAVVKGDAKSFSIAAASIIAKVTRDRIMRKYAGKFPHYGWEHNKGYATKEHIAAIRKLGATELHRRTFLNNILSGTQEEIIFGV
ncbi:MAG: ribonuclease HII [Ignavibacteria bacterium]|nr:ribonuclease HII [Ignavibacteria bacterium]